MEMRLARRVIAGLILSGFVFNLTGCGSVGVLRPTQVRNLPFEVEAKLSRGDTRQYVRSVLGKPLVDGKSFGVEVYRQTGRDIDIGFPGVPIPMPGPGKKVIGIVLVAYDENDVVEEIATNLWIPFLGGDGPDFWITADSFHFVNNFGSEPDTLLGPSIPGKDFAKMEAIEGKCALVLLMGECVMEQVWLDDHEIADLSPAGVWCGEYWDNNFYGTFIRINISPGTHQLDVRQKERRSAFETVFDCNSGETVYAELTADAIHDIWWGFLLKGDISISKKPTKRLIDMGDLCPILWHGGTWYGVTDDAATISPKQ
jgi:hypothetical protein